MEEKEVLEKDIGGVVKFALILEVILTFIFSIGLLNPNLRETVVLIWVLMTVLILILASLWIWALVSDYQNKKQKE